MSKKHFKKQPQLHSQIHTKNMKDSSDGNYI
jgi:hypothetical protein